MKKGVIYARFSSHAQREESIEQQIDECQAFAKQNDIEIVGVYSDEAMSGRTDIRPDFQRMMRDAAKNQFDVVIAYKSNRISRNMLHALQYEDRLDKLGISTLYAREEFGNTPSGRFALRMMMSMNQFYSENMAEDIKRGLMDNAAKCKANGSLPYGYKRGADGRYEIVPSEAEIVRIIFDDCVHGISYMDTARKLNDQGLRTRRGKKWTDSTFVRLLGNEAYIGVYSYSGVRVEGGVPPIVDRAVFEAAQERLKTRKVHRKGEAFLLSGKLFCGRCNSPMTGMSGTSHTGMTYYYYRCRNQKRGECDMPVVPKDIEDRVADIVREQILVPETIEQIADALMDYQASQNVGAERDLVAEQLKEVRSQIGNILKAIESGIFSESVNARLRELEQRQSDLESRYGKLKAVTLYDREHIIFALSKFAEDVANSRQYKKVIINTFVKAVWIYDDHLKIDCFYGSGIKVSSPTGEKSPPNALRTNLIVFADFFSFVVK